MYGFIESAALFCASQSGMLTRLATSDQALGLAEIAAHSGMAQAVAERILNATCASGIVLQTMVQGQPGYAIAGEVRDYFVPQSARFIGGFIDHLAQRTLPAAAGLHQAAKADMPIQSKDRSAIFSELYSDSKAVAAFMQAMWDLGLDASRELVRDPVFANATHLVDLGGGPGHFAIAAAEQYAKLRATVFDLAPVAPHFDKFASNSPACPQLGFIQGDFWQDALPPAQLYALGYVLSDWQDAHCVALLQKIHAALPEGGHVLIAEKLFDPGCHSPYSTVMLDISMLLETQGRHRTAEGYQDMLRQAGFGALRIKRSSGEKHLLIGQKMKP
jgi:hypothetical protein